MEISQDQILGEGNYASLERQSLYCGHILALCSAGVLSAWDRIEEVGKKIESKVIQDPKETFIDVLQRLTSVVNRIIPNSEARQTTMNLWLLKMLILNAKE